jgi:hypothetical protein
VGVEETVGFSKPAMADEITTMTSLVALTMTTRHGLELQWRHFCAGKIREVFGDIKP